MAGGSGLPDCGGYNELVLACVRLMAVRRRVEAGELSEEAARRVERAVLDAARELVEGAPMPGGPVFRTEAERDAFEEQQRRDAEETIRRLREAGEL